MESINDKSAEVSGGVACPKCGVDVMQAGFVVQEVRYQAFHRSNGKMVKSHAAKSGFETATCITCSERLEVDVKILKAAA